MDNTLEKLCKLIVERPEFWPILSQLIVQYKKNPDLFNNCIELDRCGCFQADIEWLFSEFAGFKLEQIRCFPKPNSKSTVYVIIDKD